MKLNRTPSLHDRKWRNEENENWRKIEESSGKVDSVISEAEKTLTEAKKTNAENKDVQNQLDNLVIESGNANAEVSQARGDHALLKERFEDIESKRGDFAFNSNSTQPPKKGFSTNTYKLVRKIDADTIEVFQKTTSGYVRYVFQRNTGGSGYGIDYEALRIVRAEPISDIGLFKKVNAPTSGTVSRTFSTEGISPGLSTFFDSYNANSEKFAPSTNGELVPWTIATGASVTYRVDKPLNGKVNIVFFSRQNYTGNDTINIKVNGRVARTVTIDDSFNQSFKRFDIPVFERATTTGSPLDITVENTSSNEVYICAINLLKLSEYAGESVDSYFAMGSNLHPFISNTGASDYAFRNAENDQLFGSYHGGEVNARLDIMWRGSFHDRQTYVDFESIEADKWAVMSNFSFRQSTVLIGRAYMRVDNDFNTDGTLQSYFSYSLIPNADPIPLSTIWVAIVCTDPNFRIVRYPFYSPGTDTGHLYFDSTEGYVIQETPAGNQQVHTRYSRFNNEYVGDTKASSISRAAPYHKLYYAPVRNTDELIYPSVFQFSRAIDCFVY